MTTRTHDSSVPKPTRREDNAERLAAVRGLRLLDSPAEPAFDRLTALALGPAGADRAGVARRRPTASSSRAASVSRDPRPRRAGRRCHIRSASTRSRRERPLVIPDARTDPRVWDGGAVAELGVVAYLGVPLVTRAGHALGSFCVIDAVPRAWTPEDVETLTSLAGR
jgi:GAF domain-containing protein